MLAIIASILDRVGRTHSQIARLVGRPGAHSGSGELIGEDLTATESRIAGAVAKGLSNKAIASEFNISVRTVEHHVLYILAKKNFSNRVEIALCVKQHTTGH